jgi:hypothetical protein
MLMQQWQLVPFCRRRPIYIQMKMASISLCQRRLRIWQCLVRIVAHINCSVELTSCLAAAAQDELQKVQHRIWENAAKTFKDVYCMAGEGSAAIRNALNDWDHVKRRYLVEDCPYAYIIKCGLMSALT